METEEQTEKEKQNVSRYDVRVSQGLQKLYGENGSGSILHTLRTREYEYPFTMTVYRDPTRLAHPVRVVTGLNHPCGIAFNSHGEMIVSECWGHQIAIFDIKGQRIRTFGSEQMILPSGIAIDIMDNIYVASCHKLQKFTSNGKLIRCIGQDEGEFNVPLGITIYDNQVYVCDIENCRIQVFDLDLNFIRSIVGIGETFTPNNVKFDWDGNMYVTDSKRVQVLDRSGHFIKTFCDKEMDGPTAIHIVDKYVYVCNAYRILVYNISGNFVTSFDENDVISEDHFIFRDFITSCANGFIYVPYCESNIIKVF